VIIECKKCGTKYRFDESQIEGDGVWVRCTRCEETFFQENPLAEPPPPVEALEPEREERGRAAVEGGAMPEGPESSALGRGPTWEDTYRDPGEGITIVGADEIEGRDKFPGDITIEDEGTGPAVEDAFREPREETPFEGLEKEIPEEDAPALGGLEAEDLDTEIRGSGVFHDADEEAIPVAQGQDMEGGEKILGDISLESDAPEIPAEDIFIEPGQDIPEEHGPIEIPEEAQGPSLDDSAPVDAGKRPQWEDTYDDVGEITGGEETRGRQRVREPWTLGNAGNEIHREGTTGKRGMRRVWGFVWKAVLLLVLIAVVGAGLYLWLVPEARETAVHRFSPWAERFLGEKKAGETKKTVEAIIPKETAGPKADAVSGTHSDTIPDSGHPELKVNLVNVGERFVKGWTDENVMVVEGSAVNANTVAVSNIRVRGKILDGSGNILGKEESHCGTILTDDELKTLTWDEIKKELSNPYGRDFRNADIQPGDGIPFMLVFTMPAEEASELVVELIEINAAKNQ
jgi:predicted Zn finger-like uncharacterized protein